MPNEIMMVEAEKMAEKKTVSRKAPLILGMVAAMLAVGLAVALIVYLPLNGTINSLNTQIDEKNQHIATLNLQITTLQSQIDSLNSTNTNIDVLENQIANLQAQIQSLSNVLSLNASATLVETQTLQQDPSTNSTIWDQPDQPLIYAGYVTVQVESSSNLTYVQLYYDSHGVVYDNVVRLGNGTAAFPVLPGNVFIVIGNEETADQVTTTVTATYYY
jgi:cell division protein FtsL